MQTNPESAAVEAVAWVGPLGQLIKNDRFQARVNGLPDHGDLSTYTALYPQSALDALRGEIAENEGVIRVWRRRCEEAERRVAELERVCAEAYQVVGVLLSDTDQFDTDHGEKILDNLSEARIVHEDVLPWESKEVRHG